MATSKQPQFPTPPLEWGIPQYPTPNVPDFYTKDGHIILVEKVSAEKGSYNPQPLDGSVTYSKRDANKWPTDLYLVYQKPDETGAFVYNYYANDRTLASQNAWNFGLDYSANNPSFPVTSRIYIVPRSQYETVALGSTDPVFGGDQIIAAQKKVELPEDNPLRSRYVGVQRVYETIPGPILSGKKLNDRGDIETITQQTVVSGTAPDADGLLVTQTAVQPVDSVKSTKTTGTVESYATLASKANRGGLLGSVSISDNIVSPSTNPDALSQTVLDSTVEAISATKSRKRTTTSTGPTSLSGDSKKSGLLGNVSTTESIVAYGANADNLSTTVLQSDVIPIDRAKSKKTTITLTGPNSLTGYQYDEFFDKKLTITQSIVDPNAPAPSFGNGLLSYKDEPIDSAKSKRTVVSTPGLPPTRTEYKTGTYTSPLLVFSIQSGSANLACPPLIPDVRIKLTPITRAAQTGPTTFKTVTSYSYGEVEPEDGDIFSPELKEVSFTGYVINFNLGAALCNTIQSTITVVDCGLGLGVEESWNITPSSPTASSYLGMVGQYKKISWESRYWKAGIWESKTIYVKLI